MIGYFDDAKIQDYPMGLGMFYPSQGNFIAAIGNFKSRELTAKYCTSFKKLKSLNCERLIAPSFIEGVDFSDHLNYWMYDIPAMMITDTAFFRNKNYHTKNDTSGHLDIHKISQVVSGLVMSILDKDHSTKK